MLTPCLLLTLDDGAVLCSREDKLAVTSDSDTCQRKLVTTAVADVIHSRLHILQARNTHSDRSGPALRVMSTV